MKLYKRYINVLAYFNKEGHMVPRAIIWDDGISYEVDKVLQIKQQVHSELGGNGTSYLCKIGGYERTLFFERGPINRWFIESKKP